jgi:carotenoid cleavage dioxygenase
MNAYDDDGGIVLDVARYGRLDFMLPEAARDPKYRDQNSARMHRWRIDLERGGVASTPLDDAVSEFPRVDGRLVGRRHRFGYVAAREDREDGGSLPLWSSVRKYDLDHGTFTTRHFGEGNGVGEPIFVPRQERAAEDDGWVLALCYDQARDTSDFFILDARDIAGEPVATVRMPHRVPYGFHGNWAAGVA